MKFLLRKIILIPIIFIVVFGIGAAVYFVTHRNSEPVKEQPIVSTEPKYEVVGKSVQGRNIESYTYGNGSTSLMFVGGIHGGYEWNSVLLAYQIMDYIKENPEVVPKNLKVTIIPAANPDGVYKIIGKEGRFTLGDVPGGEDQSSGRFNAHNIDLNRNFACNWKSTSTWRSKVVSAGTKAFSEPEAAALRDFIQKEKPSAVVWWHSQANAVYASQCNKGILPETLDIMNAYAKAAKYPSIKKFDAYAISGDAEGWLASIGIPAITVEMKTHESVEFDKNLAGVKALFEYYSRK
jgi:g-D-glutamyl-meso-diaminopimelate peptidase